MSSSNSSTISPLPRGQIFSAIMFTMCEAIEMNILFPFIVFMVSSFGFTGSSVGLYCGLLSSVFTAAQFLSAMRWGVLSDQYGRKPILIWGILGAGVSMLIFGTAKTVTQAMCGRILSGLLSGNSGVNKSFVAEFTDKTNRPLGLSYISVAWFSGCIVGPLLGGLLCEPADKYPLYFSKDGLFGEYPYLLPCLASCLINVMSSFIAYFVMVETRQSTNTNFEMTAVSNSKQTLEELVGLVKYDKNDEDNDTESLCSSNEKADLSNSNQQSNEYMKTGMEVEMEVEMQLIPGEAHENGMDVENQMTATAASPRNSPVPGDEIQYVSVVPIERFAWGDCLLNAFGCARCTNRSDNTNNSLSFTQLANSIASDDCGVEIPVTSRKLVVLPCINYALLGGGFLLFDQTFPLFVEENVAKDGMGFSSSECGIAISIAGFVGMVATLTIVPRILMTYPTHQVYRWACIAVIPGALMIPCVGYLYHYDEFGTFTSSPGDTGSPNELSNSSYTLLWTLVLLGLSIKNVVGCVVFQAVFLQISHCVPSSSLGTANGLGQSLVSLTRTVGPAIGGALWGPSVKHHFLILNFAIGVAVLLVSFNINNELIPLNDDLFVKKCVYDGFESGELKDEGDKERETEELSLKMTMKANRNEIEEDSIVDEFSALTHK